VSTKRISDKQLDTLIKLIYDVAYNLWWSWNPSAQQLFHELSPFFWELSNHNPVEVIKWVSGRELRERLQNQEYFKKVLSVCASYHDYLFKRHTWARKHVPSLAKAPVAYFSAEFGLHESLRIYSGGLGILAGDHAKSASDLGVPFIGVTLFYRQGYFQQQISADGWQLERYPTYEPAKMPIKLVADRKGNPIICSVEIGNDVVRFRGWEVKVGRATVYLIDTDLPDNEQRIRDLTAHVYGGDQWTRISQEILLGIGGVRFLRALGISPGVFHMNEGHSAFLTLELLREQLHTKQPLNIDDVAIQRAEEYVRERCVFTTHTPVPAGHDRFDQGLMNGAFPAFSASIGFTVDRIMRYGRIHQDDGSEPFDMTVLALRMCRAANGVSELHGKVSREMWKDLYPGIPVEKVPIGYVTNGVHTAGWTAPTAMQFWATRLGPHWIDKVRDEKFWHKSVEMKKISDFQLISGEKV